MILIAIPYLVSAISIGLALYLGLRCKDRVVQVMREPASESRVAILASMNTAMVKLFMSVHLLAIFVMPAIAPKQSLNVLADAYPGSSFMAGILACGLLGTTIWTHRRMSAYFALAYTSHVWIYACELPYWNVKVLYFGFGAIGLFLAATTLYLFKKEGAE